MNDNFRATIQPVKRKLAEKDIHLGNSLTFNKVNDFELQHGIILPEDYRKFLTEIGNGGDGGDDWFDSYSPC